MGDYKGHCLAGLIIDFDSIDCSLPTGHAGQHLCVAEGGEFMWEFRPRPWSSDLIRDALPNQQNRSQ